MNDPKVAIIIPVKSFNKHLEICLKKCLELDYPNFEILVFPDNLFSEFEGKVKVIPTGNMGPALKRDKALAHSQAELFAFLDDDAYPERDWLKNAIENFKDQQVAAIAGPAVTPADSPILETASGNVLASPLASGPYGYRYIPGQVRMEVDDYPSCNFIVRRNIFEKLGGFSNQFWPGEDTKLCLDITKKLGKKIVYDPKVLVQHYRRPLFLPHLKQVANYALHRGYFAKKFPETSLKLSYFMPSLFLSYLIAGAIISYFSKTMALIYLNSIVFYYSLIFFHTLFSVLQEKKIKSNFKKVQLILLTSAGIMFTHFCYGLFFIKGLILRKLKEEK